MELKEFIERALDDSEQALSRALEGLTPQELAFRPGEESNSIGFILWHMSRGEDFLIQNFCQSKTELYETQGWAAKCGTGVQERGGNYTVEQLRTFVVPQADVLLEYRKAVRESTLGYLHQLPLEELDAVPRPDRPQDSKGRMFRRLILEIGQHLGHIAYLRGMQRGLGK